MSSAPLNVARFTTGLGIDFEAPLLHFDRYSVVFELHGPAEVLRVSESLDPFKVVCKGNTLYSGKAVLTSVIHTGVGMVCQGSLEQTESSPDFAEYGLDPLRLAIASYSMLNDWEKLYSLRPEYKLIVADMESFLTELRGWSGQIELGVRSSPSGERREIEHAILEEISKPIMPAIDALFARFEAIAIGLEEECRPMHRSWMRRRLHPLMLCSPFAYRTFTKPLGYAGDYEMVNMMLRGSFEGSTVFAKLINHWFWRQPPAEAHRNRVQHLVEFLVQECLRVTSLGRRARVLNVGCGPAMEVQKFLDLHPLSDQADVTLVDFNEETLHHARAVVEQVKRRQHRSTVLEFSRKSVQQLLKEGSRSVRTSAEAQFDFAYCAGLFDYLPDPVCHRMMDILYGWLAPGGLLLATNVDPSNPLRQGMEHLLDWHLIYRNGHTAELFRPSSVPPDHFRIRSDLTGVNLLIEARRPAHE